MTPISTLLFAHTILSTLSLHLYVGDYQFQVTKPFFKLSTKYLQTLTSKCKLINLTPKSALPQCSLSVITLIFFKTLQSETLGSYLTISPFSSTCPVIFQVQPIINLKISNHTLISILLIMSYFHTLLLLF